MHPPAATRRRRSSSVRRFGARSTLWRPTTRWRCTCAWWRGIPSLTSPVSWAGASAPARCSCCVPAGSCRPRSSGRGSMLRDDDLALARSLADALDGRAEPTGELQARVRVLEAAAVEAHFAVTAEATERALAATRLRRRRRRLLLPLAA